MRCPQCSQDMTPTSDNKCGLCGAPLVPAPDRVRSLYMITSALFFSTLVYAVLVMLMEQSPREGLVPGHGDLWTILPSALLGLTPIIFVIGQLAAGHVAESSPMVAAIIECAAAEACCILGLVLYFVLRSVPWFVIFLGISWLMFLFTAFRIPKYASRLLEQQ